MSDSSRAEQVPPSSLKILYVEDEPAVQKLVALYLRNEGHQLTLVNNGAEGLNKIQVSDFDLVVTDRSMPLMDGIRLARELERLRPGLPVVLITGTPPSEDQKGEQPSNIRLVLTKPVTPDQLRQAIAKLFPSR